MFHAFLYDICMHAPGQHTNVVAKCALICSALQPLRFEKEELSALRELSLTHLEVRGVTQPPVLSVSQIQTFG